VRNARLHSVAALLLMVAVLFVPLRSLAALGRTVGTATPPNQLTIRSANRLRSPGVLAPRLFSSERAVGTGKKHLRLETSGRFFDIAARTNPGHPPLALPNGHLAVFPLRC